MSLTENPLNHIIRNIKIATGRFTQGPAPKPPSAALGSTSLQQGPVRGASRSPPVMGGQQDLRQWRAPGGGTTYDTPRRR